MEDSYLSPITIVVHTFTRHTSCSIYTTNSTFFLINSTLRGVRANQPEPATDGKKKMGSSGDHDQLHIFFFPFMAHGHTIPCVDMAKLFAARGHRATIVTTPLNRPPIAKSIQSSQSKGLLIDVRTVRFSAAEAGLPEGHENADAVTSGENSGEMLVKFFSAVSLLQEPFEELLQECRPDCVVADMFFPWATDSCSEFGIPRLVFHGTSSFSLCAGESIRLYSPHKKVSSDSEQFVLPNFPGEIKLTRNELPDFMKQDDDPDSFMFRLLRASKESEVKSFGVIVNSFYELEPAYADHYRNVLGRRAWYIGPVSLSGRSDSVDENGCSKWLDSKEPNSVVYVCFGSMAKFSSDQLKEIAKGLEASGQDFIWVVRRKDQSEEWLPEGFEERVGGRGLIIRGWAPQVSILDHEAVGGFVTHCGWNSTLEGITAGKPMLTWPLFAEQFYNEKLVTQVLRTGVSVGATKWARLEGEHVASDAVENGVRRVMAGEEAEEMRARAQRLGEKAHIAVEEGGSSFNAFHVLIQDLVLARPRS